ncbi:Transcriptional activator NphR [compost metagenome]
MTPHRWLTAHRIERACALLAQADLSIAAVALACGFSDQSHLTRVFAQALGTTPGMWRR